MYSIDAKKYCFYGSRKIELFGHKFYGVRHEKCSEKKN